MKEPAHQHNGPLAPPRARCVWLPLAAAIAAAAAGCGADSPVNSFSAKVVVQDKAVMLFIREFAIGVLYETSKKKSTVTCADFPGTYYTVEHPDLRVAANRQISWSGQETAPTEVLEVPPDQPLVVVVEGRAPYNAIKHVVARGCAEHVRATKKATQSVEVDVRATAGRSCTSPTQCERSLGHCLVGDGFPAQGYCGVANCAADDKCPPGTKCTYIGAGTACTAVCEQSQDCETGNGLDCVRGLGPSGCHGACLKPNGPYQSC